MGTSRPRELLIVGPAGHPTGGIARYIAEQRRRLPDDVSVSLYDNATPNGEGPVWFLRSALLSLALAVRFPFRSPPDVVHVHTSHYFSFYLSAFYTLFAAYVWDRPVVLHTHGSSFDEFVLTDSRLLRRLQSIVFETSDAVVVLSEYWRAVVGRRAPPEKLVILPNAVSVDEYAPRTDVDPPHVVFVSNHIRRKGLPEFVEAIRRLSDDPRGEFAVTICGSGPLSDLAADLAAEYDHVSYRGYVDEPTKREVLNHGSIYVLPTHAEGLPIALLEAMAAGNAVISTDVGGIPDLLGSDNGITVSPGDVDGLTAALERLLDDPERVGRMAERNRELVVERYSWNAVTADLVTLYDDLAADRAGDASVTG